MIHIIAAIDRNRAIGYQNRLLFRLPDDLKRFKALTTSHTVVMGRVTFESLPKGALPNRRNIVLSTHEGYQCNGAEVYASLEAALARCGQAEEVFIIGGATLYRHAMPLADVLHITHVDAVAPYADAWFPPIAPDEWQPQARLWHGADEKHACPFTFVDYVRR
ncbi:MAG: dihydrofolate reductase [Prevotellaceae bacterium]|nr:dihydrofolate reductase [Prevotellaceae bacterium]